jgi:hypothetical protein
MIKRAVGFAGVGIHLEPGGRNSYPKTEHLIQLRFTLTDRRCELQVFSFLAEDKFDLTVDDPSSWKAVIEYIIAVLVRGFKLAPWEAYSVGKQRIGFIWMTDIDRGATGETPDATRSDAAEPSDT